MAYDRLSAQDVAFLRIEKPNQPQHVGSLSVFEGEGLRDPDGRLPVEELRAFVQRRLRRVPRLRQRLMFVPFDHGHPIWVDDDRFDIDYHVRLTALPRPGDERQLHELMGRLQSQPLDRSRPLWELWVVDGLADGRVASILKSHHCLGDGIALVDLAMALVDLEPHPVADDLDLPWAPAPAPSTPRLWLDSVAEQLTRPLAAGRDVVGSLLDPQRAIRYVTNLGRAATTLTGMPQAAPWNVPVTQHRRWVSARVPLEAAKRTRQLAGCTVNDVVVAACTGALRDFLAQRGEAVDDRRMKAMVPVSTRREDEHGTTAGNKVSLMTVDLPVREPDPVARLAQVHAETALNKTSGLVEGAQAVVELADAVPVVAAPLTRLLSNRMPMNLVITNVPGPPLPLYFQGARLLETYPYVEVVDNEGLTVAVVSYEGELFFGLTADRDVIPDLDVLAEGIEKSFAELEAAVEAAVDASAEAAVPAPHPA